MTCPLSILPIPKGTATWGYPPVPFEPFVVFAEGLGCLPGLLDPPTAVLFLWVSPSRASTLSLARNEKTPAPRAASRRS